MQERIIKAVLIEPGFEPRIVTIPNTVLGFQTSVKGAYEICYDAGFDLLNTDSVSICCNECVRITQSQPYNRTLYDKKGNVYDKVYGNLLVVGYNDEGEIISLTEEQINKTIEHYKLKGSKGKRIRANDKANSRSKPYRKLILIYNTKR
jgi:hypothetical protein